MATNDDNIPAPSLSAWYPAVAAVSPFLVLGFLFFGVQWSLTGPFGLEKTAAILFLCTIGLLLSARWLSRSFSKPLRVIPLLAGVAVVWLGWLWQRFAYLAAIPHHFLQYGYFLSPVGKHARLLVVELPLVATLATLALVSCVSLVLAWRSGARWCLVLVAVWWLVAGLVFYIPSLYLQLQGDAAIFI